MATKTICDMCRAETINTSNPEWVAVEIKIYPGMDTSEPTNIWKHVELCPQCHESPPGAWNFRVLIQKLIKGRK